MKKTTLLCILDGFGHREEADYNAIHHAHTPNLDRILQTYPHSLLEASGESVGLPDGQSGNSEVGHLNIGAGRVMLQLLPQINKSVRDDSLKDKKLLNDFIKKLQNSGGDCHLLGILSDGGVHGHEDHILYLAKYIASQNIKTHIHAFLDGRDTLPQSAITHVEKFIAATKNIANINLATICGRYYAMDRDNNWDRTEIAYTAIAQGSAIKTNDFATAIKAQYQAGITDEFIKPHISSAYDKINAQDGFLISNYRADRARQIATAFLDKDFTEFAMENTEFAAQLAMAEYSKKINQFLPALFPNITPKNILADVISDNDMMQLHIAETEKYAHVTFFFNGGIEKEKTGEDRILIPSPQVKTYDLQPEMSAPQLTEKLLTAIKQQKYDFIVVNFANPDMVGHTGKWEAALKAVEQIDISLGLLEKTILDVNGNMLVTADHGNIEYMFDQENNQPFTAHTLNKVPFIMINKNDNFTLKNGSLRDIAPTILSLIKLQKPDEMTGKSLIIN